jgi:hypothetical protein
MIRVLARFSKKRADCRSYPEGENGPKGDGTLVVTHSPFGGTRSEYYSLSNKPIMIGGIKPIRSSKGMTG